MGKHKYFKFMGLLNILGEAETHSIPKIWEKWIPIIRVWEKTNIPNLWVSQILRAKQKSIQFPKYGKSEFT